MVRAVRSRRFSWRLMLSGGAVGGIVGVMALGWRMYPWLAVPFIAAGAFVLHPLMDREVPSLIDLDMLKSPRTYGAALLCVIGQILARPEVKAIQDHLLRK